MIAFARHSLGLPIARVGGMITFLCLQRDMQDDVRTLQLLLLYAVYSATNCIRYCNPALSLHAMHEFLLQYVHQGASQMSSTQRVVHDLLTTTRRVRQRLA